MSGRSRSDCVVHDLQVLMYIYSSAIVHSCTHDLGNQYTMYTIIFSTMCYGQNAVLEYERTKLLPM